MAHLLEIEDLYYRYDSHAPWLFHGINLTLRPGLYGLIGLNGSGKTTLLKCLAGIYHPHMGKINLFAHGRKLRNQYYKERLGYVPQEFSFYDELSVEQYLSYIADMKLIPRRIAAERMKHIITAFALNNIQKSRINILSTGQKKRLMIAQSLLADPRLILLDEPLDGLDLEERYHVMTMLHHLADDCIIILASHIIAEVEQWLEQVMFITEQGVTSPRSPQHWKLMWLQEHDHREPTLEDVLLWLCHAKQ